jgi:hypothetical protein
MITFVRRRLNAARNDAGAMLLIALIIITTVALVTGAMLSHASTNLTATVSLRSVAGTSYAADTAAKLAINNLRLGSDAPEWTTPGFNGTWNDGIWDAWVYANYSDGTGCFGAQGTTPRNKLVFPAVYPRSGEQTSDPSARVECTPVPGTGILGAGGGVVIADPDETDSFSQALTTVGTSTSDYCRDTSVSATCSGVYFKVLGTGDGSTRLTAPIGGGITSRTRGMVDLGDVVTDGAVYAINGCTSGSGSFVSPDRQCSRSSVVTPTVPTSRLTSFPTGNIVTTMPTPNSSGVCTFTEGAYLSGKALSDAMTSGGCTTSVFTSGKYYFDFLDGQTWTMSNKVIGGEVIGSAATANIPGACQSPIKFPTTDGVLFVFGGSSNFDVANGAKVELCGKANSDGSAPLTIFQQQTGSTPSPATVGPVASGNVTTLATVANSRDAFTVAPLPTTDTLTQAVAATGTTTAAWKATKKDNVGELDLQDFAGLTGVPAGNVITSAKLKVTYSSGLSAGATFTAGVTGQAATVPVAASGTDTDITAILNSQLAAGAFSPTNPKIRLIVGGTTKANDTLSVDAVTLQVTHVSPALRPATSSVFFSTKSNSTARFVVQGATYAPQGTINIDAGQTAFIAFRWGLLAKGVGFKTYPQQVFGYPLVSIPKPGSGLGPTVTAVDLKVFVCTDGSTCATGGVSGADPTLIVRVLITDPPYTDHPVAGKRRMQVLSWAELN